MTRECWQFKPPSIIINITLNYFSTYTTGFENIMPKILADHLSGCRVIAEYNGLILYEDTSEWQKIRELPMFTGSFVLVANFVGSESKIGQMLHWSASSNEFVYALGNFFQNNHASVKIVTSVENKTTSLSLETSKEIEARIRTNPNITIDHRNPRFEIWFIERSERIGLIGIKLPSIRNSKPGKGELHPELVYVLNYLSEPSPQDVFLDLFCGSGAIPLQRAKHWKYKKIIASDVNVDMVTKRFNNTKPAPRNFTIHTADATNMSRIADASISKIVTDPPWGKFNKVANIDTLYRGFLSECCRVLARKGIAVILTAEKELVPSIISEHNLPLHIQDRYNILVSGQKAAVFKIIRTI